MIRKLVLTTLLSASLVATMALPSLARDKHSQPSHRHCYTVHVDRHGNKVSPKRAHHTERHCETRPGWAKGHRDRDRDRAHRHDRDTDRGRNRDRDRDRAAYRDHHRDSDRERVRRSNPMVDCTLSPIISGNNARRGNCGSDSR